MRIAEIVDGVVVRISVSNTADTSAEFLMTNLGGLWVNVPDGMEVGVEYTWDADNQWFIPPKNYESWVLDEEQLVWVSPIPKPNGDYVWNEETLSWDPVDSV